MERICRHVGGFYRGLRAVASVTQIKSIHNSTQFPRLSVLNKNLTENAALSRGLGATRSFVHFGLQSPTFGTTGLRKLNPPAIAKYGQQTRGIRVKVLNGNLERALLVLQRKMISSGMERLIRNVPRYHLKDSEKRILAKKRRERKERSQELARKLKSILIRKVRGLWDETFLWNKSWSIRLFVECHLFKCFNCYDDIVGTNSVSIASICQFWVKQLS